MSTPVHSPDFRRRTTRAPAPGSPGVRRTALPYGRRRRGGRLRGRWDALVDRRRRRAPALVGGRPGARPALPLGPRDSLGFSPDAKLLASGNDDLILWDVATGQLVNRIAQSSWVTAVAFSADGRTLASGHDDGVVRFWDAANQKFAGELRACPNPVALSAIAFSPRGELVATAGEDRVVRVWDAKTHKPIAELKSHTDRVPALAWSPGREPAHLRRVGHLGARLAAAADRSGDASQQPRRPGSHAGVQPGRQVPRLRRLGLRHPPVDRPGQRRSRRGAPRPQRRDSLPRVQPGRDSKLASAGADRVIHVWDVRDGKLLAGPNAKGRHSVAVIPGNPLRLASSAGPAVRVWDTATGEEVAPTNLCPAYTVAASPDGKWLAVGGTDHFTQLWDAAGGILAASLEATKPPIGFATFSADSKFLAHTSPADGLVWIWNCETKNPDLILIEAADGCTLEGVSFHPDGQRVAAGGIDYLSTGERDGAVCVWDIPTKEKLYTIDVGVYAVAFDPAGKYLAGAGMDDAVYVWDAETQDTMFVLGGPPAEDQLHRVRPERELPRVGRRRPDGPRLGRAERPAADRPRVRLAGPVARVQPGRQVPLLREREHHLLSDRVQEAAGGLRFGRTRKWLDRDATAPILLYEQLPVRGPNPMVSHATAIRSPRGDSWRHHHPVGRLLHHDGTIRLPTPVY